MRCRATPKAFGAVLQFHGHGCATSLALYFVGLKNCAISSVVERLLHTQEVAGSNPASRTVSSLSRNLTRELSVERSPRRQVRDSNPASPVIFLFAREGNNLQK